MIYNAIILTDPWATLITQGVKKIETRTRLLKQLTGDVVICCSNSSTSTYAGLALCIVNVFDVRQYMLPSDAEAACFPFNKDLVCYFLKDWRVLQPAFQFSKYRVEGSWQGVFKLEIPNHIEIISKPDILPVKRLEQQKLF